MIYSIDFLSLTEKLNPKAVCKYLNDTDWEYYDAARDNIAVYQYIKDEIFEQVTIPLNKELRDYHTAMFSVVKTIAKVENKSVEQLMLYLLNPNTDILKIRLDKKETESGNILFDDAIRLFDNAKKLMAAAALDIINPKKIHMGRMDDSVQKFLSQCRFGQTEIGSYVASVVCPFAELSEEGYRQLTIFSEEEECANSLTRQVTNRIISNISYIKDRIDNGELNELIDSQEYPIISSNFFEALNGLNLESENTIVEFIADWSPIVKQNRLEIDRIEISNDYYQPIVAVIEKIKETSCELTEIIGRIKSLDARPELDERRDGTVTIVYLGDNNKAKTVKVKLQLEDYDNAWESHRLGKSVKVSGEFDKRTKQFNGDVLFSILE